MSQTSDAKSSRPRFLSRSKWGKVFKENENSKANEIEQGRESSDFALNDDVSDFLRPSREASAEKVASVRTQMAPKLNITIAQKWPATQGIRLRSASSPATPQTRPIYTKPPRMLGLSVRFAVTKPDVIGHGGDESTEPVAEISRRRILLARSSSEHRAVAGFPPAGYSQTETAEDFSPKPLRRAQTSFNERSPAFDRKHAVPPPGPSYPEVPDIDRAVDLGIDGTESKTRDVMMPVNLTSVVDPPTPSSASQKYHDMRISEGVAFRRASTMIFSDDDEQEPVNSAQSPPSLGIPAPVQANPSPSPSLGLSPYAHTATPDALRQRTPSSSSSINYLSASQQADPVMHSRSGSNTTLPTAASAATSPPLVTPNSGMTPADTALIDFSGRVEHMRGVFKLTADKERRAEQCDHQAWLRAGLWWYLKGKLGLEDQLLRRSPRGDTRELLTQAHVDLAKALWILQGPLQNAIDSTTAQQIGVLKSALALLCTHMFKEAIMPPHQSLIQGQDIRIWIDYPPFHPSLSSVLSGDMHGTSSNNAPQSASTPLDLLPVGDSSESFCYGRLIIEATINTDDGMTDRVPLPCICSMTRSRRQYQLGLVIASQSRDINLRIGGRITIPSGLSWSNISWKASSTTMIIHLPQRYDVTVKMQENDYRRLWSTVEHSRAIERSLAPRSGEVFVHDAPLVELQYADAKVNATSSSQFPFEKLSNCRVSVFEQINAQGPRKRHEGYRVVLFTEPTHKNVSSVDHELSKTAPLYFEYLTDAAAQGTTAMVVRIRDDGKSCRALLVFPNAPARQAFYDIINGLTVAGYERIIGRMHLKALSVRPALKTSKSAEVTFDGLEWQKVGVTNAPSNEDERGTVSTIGSDRMRIVLRHVTGCLTDWMNLDKGDLLIRLPCGDNLDIQILRQPQSDFTISLDSRHTPQQVMDGMWSLLQLVRDQPTVRTLTFASSEDLHAFQMAITGYKVCFEGVAATFGISRRMMVVPIYHKWQASLVRLQVVAKDGVVKVLAFMDGFSRTDAMCIQVKSTDVFETAKGDAKGKKWTIKLVDAKFSLPRAQKSDTSLDEEDAEEASRRRFVNLDGLEYAEEHDDITIGFDSQEVRDAFAGAMPATATAGHAITLRRRI